jgi:hypothetical protein
MLKTLTVCLTLLASTAWAQAPHSESRLFRSLGTAHVVLVAMDTAQTSIMAGTGRYTETNPVLRPTVHYPGVLGAEMVAWAAGVHYGTAWVAKKGHPRVALALRIAAVGAQGFCVVWNARQLYQGGRYANR